MGKQINPYERNEGSLEFYNYGHSVFGEFLDFLKQVKDPSKVWIVDNCYNESIVPFGDYEAYIFCFNEEPFSIDFLKTLEEHLVNKKIIVLTSNKENLNLQFDKIKIFYLDHFYSYIDTYYSGEWAKVAPPKISDRENKFSLVSNRIDYHKTIALAKMMNLDAKYVYSFNHTPYPNTVDNDVFFGDLDELLPGFVPGGDIKLTIEKLLSGELDRLIPPTTLLPGATLNPVDYPDRYHENIAWGFTYDNPAYIGSKFNICVETYFANDHYWWGFAHTNAYFTEKTLKCLASGTPFFVVGPTNVHKRLADYGFKLYYHDEVMALDNLSDVDRMNALLELMEKVNQTLDSRVDEFQEIADFNRSHFFNTFVTTLKTANIPVEQQIIDYINN